MRKSRIRASAVRCAGIVWSIVVLAACVGLPRHVQKNHSEALHQTDTTALGRVVAHTHGGGRNLSGIRLLTSGDEALASLIAVADRAQRTLDVQYYIIHEDDSSRLLLYHVRLAARSEEHTSELQSRRDLVCRLLLEKKKKKQRPCLPAEKKKK